MSDHKCQVSTGRAVRLQILDAILDTPRANLLHRFSDRSLQEIEDEAMHLEAELRAEGRCRECGTPLPTTARDAMSRELSYVWGA